MNSVKVFAVVGLLGLLPACDWFSSAPQTPVKLRIVNVLEPKFFNDAHIKGGGAIASINLNDSDVEAQVKDWDKTVPVVTYCSNYFCLGSSETARKLMDLGFTDVWAYEGGMAEWYQLGKQDKSFVTEGPAQEAYLNIEIKQPAHQAENIKTISAQELQKMMKAANMLDGEVVS